MEFLYFTVAGLVLYFLSDKILNRIEIARGERFPNRSLIFLVIIMALAVGLFSLIEHLNKNQPANIPAATMEKPVDQNSAVPLQKSQPPQ